MKLILNSSELSESVLIAEEENSYVRKPIFVKSKILIK